MFVLVLALFGWFGIIIDFYDDGWETVMLHMWK